MRLRAPISAAFTGSAMLAVLGAAIYAMDSAGTVTATL